MDYRKLLLDNWGIKMVSLGLSLTLWFYVTSKGKTEMTLTVPLEMRNIPQGMTVVGDVAGSLEVRVQGQE
ncbi:MAG TPA: YbbR-like domain-containing protein, partial [Nitrospirota bacterium]|nr:YbbR-like domain-containing protein [Nitrospirota bacterium]